MRTIEVAQPNSTSLASPAFAHAFVGTNEAPLTKFSAFEKALEALDGNVELAFMKLCYVDFGPATDVDALFAEYQKMMARLGAKYPKVTFLHVTTPLTVVQGGLKGFLKRQLGSGAWGEKENVKRHAYNEKLRAAYGASVFDLAKLEATRDDGTLETYDANGAKVPKLRADFTDDGGHLNTKARPVVARALLDFLSRQRPAAPRP